MTRAVHIFATRGCPRGIGPEVLAAALQAPIGGAQVTVIEEEEPASALRALTAAALRGEADAIVTGPIRKSQLDPLRALTETHLGGQTEWCHSQLAADAQPPLMCFASEAVPFVVGLMTAHMPLSEVTTAITSSSVVQKGERLAAAARAIKGEGPLVVFGVNPHAGEGGILGTEDQREIAPAIDELRTRGIDAHGPLPADGFFAHPSAATAVLAAYHDQGLAPFKALARGTGVNVTWGLKVPRTSPDHGTADGLVGTGRADPASMRAALELARDLALRR